VGGSRCASGPERGIELRSRLNADVDAQTVALEARLIGFGVQSGLYNVGVVLSRVRRVDRS